MLNFTSYIQRKEVPKVLSKYYRTLHFLTMIVFLFAPAVHNARVIYVSRKQQLFRSNLTRSRASNTSNPNPLNQVSISINGYRFRPRVSFEKAFQSLDQGTAGKMYSRQAILERPPFDWT